MGISPSFYDEEYYEGGKGYHGYNFDRRFEDQAEFILHHYNPKSVLDFGCAKGYLVQALRNIGVEAYGYDISKYALGAAPEDVQPYVQNRLRKVDLIVSFDTFEHIPITQLKKVRDQLRAHGNRFHFVVGTLNTPDWQHDASHVSMHELGWWQEFMPEAVWEESK